MAPSRERAARPMLSVESPACFGSRCISWRAARRLVRQAGGWELALPAAVGSSNHSLRCSLRDRQAALEGSVDEYGCVPIGTGWGGYKNVCGCSDLLEFNGKQPRGEFGGSVLSLSNATASFHVLDKAALAFRDPFVGTNRSRPRPGRDVTVRMGWVPVLRKAVHAWFRQPVISPLPCSSSRGSDAVVLRSFFTDRKGKVLHSPGAVFLEAGAYDGLVESNTWFFERCLGWRGILVEGQPNLSQQVLFNRPATLNLREAACATRGRAKYGGLGTHQGLVDDRGGGGAAVAVRCGPLGARLAALAVHRIDLMVLDVEGLELTVLQTIDFSSVHVGVIVVEVRGDGSRAAVIRLLLETARFAYVGQVHNKPSHSNDVVDDVFVNLRFMRKHWPESRAFATLSAELKRKQRLDGKLDASLDDCMRGATKGFRRRMCLGIHEARVRWSAGVRWPAVGSRV